MFCYCPHFANAEMQAKKKKVSNLLKKTKEPGIEKPTFLSAMLSLESKLRIESIWGAFTTG